MTKEKYTVWFSIQNAWGEIGQKEDIAIFYSRNRADEYIKMILKDKDKSTVYGLKGTNICGDIIYR